MWLRIQFNCIFLLAVIAVAAQSPVVQARSGLLTFREKTQTRKPLTIAYLGGSITQAEGYRVMTDSLLQLLYPDTFFKSINAGVGGTGSDLGAFRLQKEVLSFHPDLVIVEFAVNDAKTDTVKVEKAMEGIVRQIKKQNRQTDILFLYTINEPMVAAYTAGSLPASVRAMERIADYYRIPSVNLGVPVFQQWRQGKLVMKGKPDSLYSGKLVFTHDATHPTQEGHRLYAETLIEAIRHLSRSKAATGKWPKPRHADNLEKARILPVANLPGATSWKRATEWPALQNLQKGLPHLLFTESDSDSLVVHFYGTMFGIEDVIGPSSCSVSLTIDGQKREIVRFDKYASWYRRNYFFLEPLPQGEHTVVIRKGSTAIDKKEILNVSHLDEIYNACQSFVGNILVQ